MPYALTVKQPFASAIITPAPRERKNLENRVWAPGPSCPPGTWIAIHAGKATYPMGHARERAQSLWPHDPDSLPLSVLLGWARYDGFYDFEEVKGAPWAVDLVALQGARASYCWVLGEVIPLSRPVPCPKGALGLWRLTGDQVEAMGGYPEKIAA